MQVIDTWQTGRFQVTALLAAISYQYAFVIAWKPVTRLVLEPGVQLSHLVTLVDRQATGGFFFFL